MDDQHLDQALAAMGRKRMAIADPLALHERAMAVPLRTQSRSGLLRSLTWRSGSMFSAAKFIVAGAFVALFGGFLLVAQPFDQQEASVPGAATDAAPQREDAASAVSGEWVDSYYWHGTFPDVRVELPLLDGMTMRERSEGNGPGGRMEMSDERLSGEVSIDAVHNIDGWGSGSAEDAGSGALWWGTILIENDGGTWEGTHYAVAISDQVGALVLELTGTGDYDGLSAILFEDWGSERNRFHGLIFPGDLPPDRE